MKEKIENNSDKAIEELKEFINNNEIQNISVFTAKKILLELEKYKRIANMNLKDSEEFNKNMCEHRCPIKSDYEEVKEDLETYKKIAEKLAEKYIALENKLDESVELDDDFCNFNVLKCISKREKSCYKCIIDWARNEVEKDDN